MLEALACFRVMVRSIKLHYQWVEEQSGLPGPHVWAMACVAELPGLRVGELARCMAIQQPTASNLVERLVQDGLAERRREETDQRLVRLYLTASGQKRLSRLPGPKKGVLQEALLALRPARLRLLTELLHELLGEMKVNGAAGRRIPLAELLNRSGNLAATRRLVGARSERTTQ